jgi:hypothetical protein
MFPLMVFINRDLYHYNNNKCYCSKRAKVRGQQSMGLRRVQVTRTPRRSTPRNGSIPRGLLDAPSKACMRLDAEDMPKKSKHFLTQTESECLLSPHDSDTFAGIGGKGSARRHGKTAGLRRQASSIISLRPMSLRHAHHGTVRLE